MYKKELTSTNEVADNFMKTFKGGIINQIDMQEHLRDYALNSKWYNLKMSQMNVVAEAGGPLIILDIKSRYDLIDCTDEAIASTICDGKVMGTEEGAQMFLGTTELNSSKKQYFLLSQTGLAGLILRAGADCSALSRMMLKKRETVINYALETTGERTVKAKFFKGKLRAVNGGVTYSILAQEKLFDSIIDMLEEKFPGYEFGGGYYTHDGTSASWTLPDQADELMEIYDKACDAVSSKTLEGFIPAIRFFTSDSGDSTATIDAVLERGEFQIKIGSPIKVQHKNNTTEQDFIDSLDGLYSKFRDVVADLAKLVTIDIEHPVNTIIDIAKSINLNKIPTMKALENFINIYGDSPTGITANDVFYVLQESLYNMRCDGKTAQSTIEKSEEDLLRLLSPNYNWVDHDVAIAPTL